MWTTNIQVHFIIQYKVFQTLSFKSVEVEEYLCFYETVRYIELYFFKDIVVMSVLLQRVRPVCLPTFLIQVYYL